jgi:hypothetical protein
MIIYVSKLGEKELQLARQILNAVDKVVQKRVGID